MNDVLESILVIYFMGLMLSVTGSYLAFSKNEREVGARIALLISRMACAGHLWRCRRPALPLVSC